MANFQFLQNLALWRLRQRGVSFGNAPGNGPTDQDPPSLVQQLLNQGYSEFLSRTLESKIAIVKTQFLTTLNAIAYPISPLPNTPLDAANPALMRILELTYTTQTGGTNAGYEYIVDLISGDRFAQVTGGYTRRLSWFGPRVLYAARIHRKTQLEVAPGTATAGDIITITGVPDPNASAIGVSAANGGQLVNPTDVPLFPQQFHMALVEYCVMNAGDAANKNAQVQAAAQKWEAYVLAAMDEGSTEDGGDPMRLVDTWGTPLAREGF